MNLGARSLLVAALESKAHRSKLAEALLESESGRLAIDIFAAELRVRGADGFANPEMPCGCELSDLAPCGDGPFPECVAGRKVDPPEDQEWPGAEWLMVPLDEGAGDG